MRDLIKYLQTALKTFPKREFSQKYKKKNVSPDLGSESPDLGSESLQSDLKFLHVASYRQISCNK